MKAWNPYNPTGDNFPRYLKWQGGLAAGQMVEVRWTGGGHQFRGRGFVVQRNKASVRVQLAEAVEGPYRLSDYPKGTEVAVPLVGLHSGSAKWGPNNCVVPVEGAP